MTITKPMLAVAVEDTKTLTYPILCTFKYDGIRCLKVDGKVLSRKFKEIPNHHIRGLLQSLPDGVDGEIICEGKTFNETQSLVMTEEGTPDFKYVIFDYVTDSLSKSYEDRMWELHRLQVPEYVQKAIPVALYSEYQLHEFEEIALKRGYEGVMIRSLNGPYKCGRSTLKEGFLLKFKRFLDSEAEVIGFEERMHNGNEAKKDELGHTKRSSHKANLVPMNTLGALIVRSPNGVEFKIGTGFDDELRAEIWKNREKYQGKLVNYQHQPSGAKDKPRFPSFRGFRDERDL